MSPRCFFWFLLSTMAIITAAAEYNYDDDSLSSSYYHKNCPQMEKIVHNKLTHWLNNDSTLAPALIRLHSHDCLIRGCDASILLDHPGSERSATSSLRGFEVIDDIKAEIERHCPQTVSCADILTAAARDATVAAGGPFWTVPYGRKDGRSSNAAEAYAVAPVGRETVTQMIELFQSKGLTVLDLVVLSGAHTIGRSRCGCLQQRLFGDKAELSAIQPAYLNFLRRKCRWSSEYVELDGVSPKKFDVQYYRNLEKKMGLLSTDQMLYGDSRTGPLVKALAAGSQPHAADAIFHHQFAASMLKLGNIQEYSDGEIRLKCSSVN